MTLDVDHSTSLASEWRIIRISVSIGSLMDQKKKKRIRDKEDRQKEQ